MDETPLVSIITPFKNTTAYLDEMLTSVLNQTYQNWELLIVDDHSTDNSFELVNSYTASDSRIKLYTNPQSGIITALREAYLRSTGVFITRMDSDDIMSSNKLESMVKDLQCSGTGNVALGLVKYFSADGIGAGFQNYENWLNDLTKSGKNYQDLYKECVIPSPCWMVYREDFEKVGGFTSDQYPEDYDLVFRFFSNGLNCIPSQNILHHWRDYSTRASRTDKNYADNTFMDLKLDYFLKLHRIESKPLVVWGAGAKGKTIAKVLSDNDVPFHWVCDNPKKIGKEIYGKIMLGFHVIDELENAQNIITVANQNAQKEIKQFFEKRGKQSMTDYFFFC
jgi:glycosyltransferase involved in cell wall biosynthesis